MSVHTNIGAQADAIRTTVTQLLAGRLEATEVAARLRRIADELDRLKRKVGRLERGD